MDSSKDWPMEYEHVLRRAFGGIGRYGDPAKIATTDALSNLNSAKAGLGYSSSILIQKAWSESDNDKIKELESIMNDLWGAKSTEDLKPLIERLDKILDQYDMKL